MEHTSACPVFLPSSFICPLPSLCPFASMTLCSSLPGPASAKGHKHAQEGEQRKGPPSGPVAGSAWTLGFHREDECVAPPPCPAQAGAPGPQSPPEQCPESAQRAASLAAVRGYVSVLFRKRCSLLRPHEAFAGTRGSSWRRARTPGSSPQT